VRSSGDSVVSRTSDEGVGLTAEAFTNAQKLVDVAQLTHVRLPSKPCRGACIRGTNLTGRGWCNLAGAKRSIITDEVAMRTRLRGCNTDGMAIRSRLYSRSFTLP
jgi:hypothetical protein